MFRIVFFFFCFYYFSSGLAQQIPFGSKFPGFTKTLNDTVFVVGDLIRAPEIHYDFNSYRIDETNDSIRKLVSFFEKNPQLIVEIIVHTDSRGSAEPNQKLSLARANAIVAEIIKSDRILSQRFFPVGKGESDPIFRDDFIYTWDFLAEESEAYHAYNRRTEIKIVGVLLEPFATRDNVYARYTKTLQDTIFVVGDLILAPEIVFDFSRSSVRPESFNSVKEIIGFLIRNPNLIIEIVVHSDCRGSDEYNQKLSLRRASSLVDIILQNESDTIFSERILPVGKGEQDLLYSCDYIETIKGDSAKQEQLHHANLRVEIKITGFLGKNFYHNKLETSRIENQSSSRESAYYEDLVFMADKALLEGNYLKALELYESAVSIGPPNDSYPSEQVKKIKEILEPNR